MKRKGHYSRLYEKKGWHWRLHFSEPSVLDHVKEDPNYNFYGNKFFTRPDAPIEPSGIQQLCRDVKLMEAVYSSVAAPPDDTVIQGRAALAIERTKPQGCHERENERRYWEDASCERDIDIRLESNGSRKTPTEEPSAVLIPPRSRIKSPKSSYAHGKSDASVL